ncbi:MAG: tetratricopeptide repeat protein [Dissulfurispiraceae bacterium]
MENRTKMEDPQAEQLQHERSERTASSLLGSLRTWMVAFLVALITGLLYLPTLKNGFVNWDDERYVFENDHIRSLDFTFLKWSFTSFYASNWHPLTWMSHAFDYALWGLNPTGHHLSSVVLHCINTFLVCVVIINLMRADKSAEPSLPAAGGKLLTRSLIVGGLTGLLFGIHPIHVESVAWVAERKDVLSACFELLSVICYIGYVGRQRDGKPLIYYFASLCCFVLALMSKPMAITLPIILVIMDVYPFRRLDCDRGSKGRKKVILEKIPFFIFSLLGAILTLMAQQAGGAMRSLEVLPLLVRIGIAVRGVCFYLLKIIFPTELYPLYLITRKMFSFSIEYAISILLVIAITACSFWAWRKGKKIFLAVWVFYMVTLLPVLGIVQVGLQAAADRYAYLPSIGVFLLIGVGIAQAWENNTLNKYTHFLNRKFVVAIALLMIALLSALTIKQIRVWHDPVTLWTYEVKGYPNAAFSYINRADAYARRGDYGEALKDFDNAIKVDSQYPLIYVARADVYVKLGDRPRAFDDLNRVIAMKPNVLLAYLNRAYLYVSSGDYQRALGDLDRAVKLKPDYDKAYNNRGIVYKEMGNYALALREFTKSIELNPYSLEAYNNRAGVYSLLKDYNNALKDLDTAVALKPEDVGAYISRCSVEKMLSHYQNAINDCSKAIAMDPKNAMAFKYRAVSYDAIGKYSEAVSDLSKAIALEPGNSEQYYDRGISYRNLGENPRALQDFNKAIELNPQYLDAYNNRGVTYGELGRFSDAIGDFNKTIILKPEYAAAYYNRGAAYYRQGKEKEAIRDFQKAARLGDKEVQKILEARGITW